MNPHEIAPASTSSEKRDFPAVPRCPKPLILHGRLYRAVSPAFAPWLQSWLQSRRDQRSIKMGHRFGNFFRAGDDSSAASVNKSQIVEAYRVFTNTPRQAAERLTDPDRVIKPHSERPSEANSALAILMRLTAPKKFVSSLDEQVRIAICFYRPDSGRRARKVL